MPYDFCKKSTGLTDQIKEAIVEMLLTEKFETNLLPSESKIAEKFGVSVPSVREALIALREEGVVTKKHGTGNYFHLSALHNNKHRLDRSKRYSSFLESNGYTVTEQLSPLRRMVARELPAQVLQHSNLAAEEPVLNYARTLCANGKPAIYCNNSLPLKYFKTIPEEISQPSSLFSLFRTCMGKEFAYGKVEYLAIISTKEEQEQIGVEIGSPVICMVSTHYSLEDLPIAYCYVKFNPEYVTLMNFER